MERTLWGGNVSLKWPPYLLVEKDPAIFEEINYNVTCHLIFPTISYIYVVKRAILLAVIHMSLSVLVYL